ncbi:MAG: phosphohydrolase, partial [Bacilli bacterium]|nr:phosphohydrolase [Bacilli bacterium]
MDQQKILQEAQLFVQEALRFDASGHDIWHIYRVTQTAKTIAKQEGADEFTCELAALLHDVADEKLNENEQASLENVFHWLQAQAVDANTSSHVMEIISMLSFKGGGRPQMHTLEGQVVQDADRLDAIGAMGIARVFAYSGAFGRPIYDPSMAPRENMTAAEYRNGRDTAIN